jgi:hypothetical protein
VVHHTFLLFVCGNCGAGRLYAMEKGLKIPVKERTKETNALLTSLMNQLEKDKKVVKLSPDDNMHMEGFALSVFAKADKQDRAGRADVYRLISPIYTAICLFQQVCNSSQSSFLVETTCWENQ